MITIPTIVNQCFVRRVDVNILGVEDLGDRGPSYSDSTVTSRKNWAKSKGADISEGGEPHTLLRSGRPDVAPRSGE